MKKTIQYWYIDEQNTNITTIPPKDPYRYDYIIHYKLRADTDHMLYNTRTKAVEKIVNILPAEEREWIEVSFDELTILKGQY